MKRKKKTNNEEKNFSIYRQPYFYLPSEPQKEVLRVDEYEKIAEISGHDSVEIKIGDDFYILSLDTDYSDDWISCLVKTKKSIEENKNYDKELRVYLEKKAEKRQLLKRWREWRKQELSNKKLREELAERETYEKLKLKFDKNLEKTN